MENQAEIYQPQRGLTFDDVWTSLMEMRKSFAESKKEMDAIQQETARQIKETGRQLGKLGNRFGELAEHLVAPNIKEKFNALGYHFDDISKDREIGGPDGAYAEIDILLENEDFSIAVEIKAKLLQKDVDEHAKRMEVIRRHKDRHHDSRKLRGAVAGAIVTAEVRDYALKAGFYVIEQSGDTVKIDVPEGFTPREW
jgi:hypothetical protein